MRPEDVCTHHGVFVGPCFTIHGRMYAANGSPSYRIWIVGSNRIFGVHEGIGETACSPPAMLDSLIREDKLIYADFVVRPVTPDTPGLMRMVCVASARHIVTRPAYFIHPRGADEVPASRSTSTPRPSPLRADWCVGASQTVDSTFAVAQATNVLQDTLLPHRGRGGDRAPDRHEPGAVCSVAGGPGAGGQRRPGDATPQGHYA
jgi:hypothetical protein